MSSPCCGSTSFNSLVCPPCCPTNPVQANCNDTYSLIIQAILNLQGDVGSSADEIFTEISNICPTFSLTLSELQTELRNGIRRGLLSWGSTTTYMVNANMAKVNPANWRYWRCPSAQNSFYRCRR